MLPQQPETQLIRRLLYAPAAFALALTALSVSAGAQQDDGWTSSLSWSDGKAVEWRATAAPACEGSNVEIRLTNKSESAGSARMSSATFICRRGPEFTSPAQRTFGVVLPGSSATTQPVSCACAEQGGVKDLVNLDIDFKREGNGTETIANGCTYTGGYSGGIRSGKGVYSCPDGYRYEGFFQGAQPNGAGTEKLQSGQTYVGEFVAGVRQGHGRMTYVDGSVYEGTYKAGLRDGTGTITFKDGSQYVGEWKADKKSGQGVYTGAGGAWVYDGAWLNDIREGQGKLSYSDGSYVYEGPFHNDLREGQATARFGDGRVFKGAFVHGEQAGAGELTFPDGRKMVGEFKDHRANGKVVQTGPQETIDGQWADGMLNGPAHITYATGETFDGLFSAGKRNGLGTTTFTDMTKEECVWANDVKPEGCTKITAAGKRIEYRGKGKKN